MTADSGEKKDQGRSHNKTKTTFGNNNYRSHSAGKPASRGAVKPNPGTPDLTVSSSRVVSTLFLLIGLVSPSQFIHLISGNKALFLPLNKFGNWKHLCCLFQLDTVLRNLLKLKFMKIEFCSTRTPHSSFNKAMSCVSSGSQQQRFSSPSQR